MPRTMQQAKVTFILREDLLTQANAESEASVLNMAELIRRAIDFYLVQFHPPEEYDTGELLGVQVYVDPATGQSNEFHAPSRKYPMHINDGLIGELDRYAAQVDLPPDEIVNRALMLYAASLRERREAAEAFGVPPSPSGQDADQSAGAVGYDSPTPTLTHPSEYVPQEEGYDPTDPGNVGQTHADGATAEYV